MDSPGDSTSRYNGGGSLPFSLDRAANQVTRRQGQPCPSLASEALAEAHPGQLAQQPDHRRLISITARRFLPERFPRM